MLGSPVMRAPLERSILAQRAERIHAARDPPAGIIRAMRRAAAVLVALAALPACGDDLSPPIAVADGTLHVIVEPRPARITVGYGPAGEPARLDTVVWQTADGGAVAPGDPPLVFAGERDARVGVQTAFGAFKFDEDTRAEAPWTGVDELADLADDGAGTVTFALRAGGRRVGTGSVSLGDEPSLPAVPGHVTIHLHFDDGDRASIAARCGPDEHFLGLGGQSFDVDHRGQTVPLWVQEDGIGKDPISDDDYSGGWFLRGRRHSTHSPMPMLLSSGGYALAVDTDARAVFALCSKADDVARYEAWQPDLELHLFAAPDPRDAIDKLTAWVGRPDLPPTAVFAPWMDAIFGSANVRRVAAKARTEGVAASVIWTEDWRGGGDTGTGYALEEDWHYDPVLYPDFTQLSNDLHAAGFDFLTYNNTFVDATADVFDEATTGGYTIHDDTGAPYIFTGVKFNDTSMIDLTSGAAVDWVKRVYREGLAAGADGWMADYGEWLPTDATLASGEDALAVHNRYPRDWARLNHELAAERAAAGKPFLYFMRSAWLGSQPLVQVFWPGDQQTDFSPGDGFPSVIPMAIGLGLTGFPYFGSDIGGYMSQTTVDTTKELWFRWVPLGALSPVMRTHHGRDARTDWNWESDAESTALFRRWTRFHMQLVPYLERLAEIAHDRGTPLMRPVALDYPDAGDWAWTTTDEYLLGDVLVAPVVTEGATSREVTLPAGTWYPLLGGAAVDGGGAAVDVDVPLGEIPAFVPAGTIICAWPDGVDSVVPGAGLVTPADVGGDRVLWLWPARDAAPRTRCEAGGGPCYQWTPRPALAGPPTGATWNGVPVTVSTGGDAATVTVTGNGTLAWDGGGQVVAEGGDGARTLTIELFGP